MGQPTFAHSLTLTEADEKRLDALQRKGKKLIDIFKKGLKATESEVKRKGD